MLSAATFINRNVWFQNDRFGATIKINAVSLVARKSLFVCFFTFSAVDTQLAAAAAGFITH